MAKLSLPELKAYVASVVTTAKISNGSFVETRDNVVGLIDKIGKIVTIDSIFAIDKLAEFDGEYLSFGKTIEEWQQDLIMPVAYDSDGAGALAPHDPTYRPVFYSYTLGRKVIKTTLRNNDIERAVHFEEQFVSIVAMQTKRLQDSMASYRYQVKREMLGKFAGLAIGLQSHTGGTAFASITTSTAVGTNVYVSGSPDKSGVLVKAWPSASAPANWAAAVAGGYIVEYDLVTSIAIPVDTNTGEAFIEQVKKDIEAASDLSEGHSLNGNTLGAIEGLVLLFKQGVQPALEVKTYAGAFNRGDLATPAEVKVIKDFGNASSDIYAILMDRRAMRLHNTYRATRENMNGDGDFLNLFDHTEDTAWISRNCFIKVYKIPA